ALVDIPFFWTLISLMFGVVLLLSRVWPLNTREVLTLVTCLIGYGASLVLFIYVVALKFRTGRSNRYIWSFVLILLNFIFYMFSYVEEILHVTFSVLIPMFPVLAWL
ncbi:ABCA5 protein, partial [Bucco capensis]|nr:ABCA5 protein [Bucco capensis]